MAKLFKTKSGADGRRFSLNVQRNGLRQNYFTDIYVLLIGAPWAVFLGVFVGTIVILNLLFGLFYYIDGGIGNSQGSFHDAFFFSVQTLATIGYGYFYPATTVVQIVVFIESMIGMLITAVFTGLLFAKFSKASARVKFSKPLAICSRNGIPSLMLRIANKRKAQILSAEVRVTMITTEFLAEGKKMRVVRDLPLVRDKNHVFGLSWTLVHQITETSPLYNKTMADIHKTNNFFVVSVSGIEESSNQAVHSRRYYTPLDIRLNEDFDDIIDDSDPTMLKINYRKFHSTHPVSTILPEKLGQLPIVITADSQLDHQLEIIAQDSSESSDSDG